MIPSEPAAEFASSGFDFEFAAPSDYARLYRLRGIQVVPAFMPTEHKSWKRPLLDSWKDFQEALVSDEVFAPWYGPGGKYVTRPNMGVITGRASNNLFVIDLDDHKTPAAAQWWNGLMAVENNSLDLETVEQRTGGGGRQKLFRAPPEWTAPTNKTPVGVDIRGQGGFAMLAPSLHESGRHYEWLEGKSPDDIPVTIAPDWLLEAVEALVVQHGGGNASGGFSSNGTEKINMPSPQGQYDGFAHLVDGRETYMRDMVWAAILNWNAECPLPVSAAMSLEQARKEYEVYEREVSPQGAYPADVSKAEALDREGRGWKTFHVKWQAAMRKWDGDVYREARKPGRIKPEPELERPEIILPKIDPTTGKPLPLIQTGSAFVGTYRPPDYLIDGLIQKGYLYSLTGPTGHGKTPTAMLMGARVALGRPFHSKQVTQGSVLFLAGENPDDIRARYVALSDHEKFDIATTPFYFVEGVIDIRTEMPRIEAEAAKIPNLSMVIIDTDQAYFLGDEGNSNEQRKWFAKTLRLLLKLPGNPTALVNCHPVKNATQDNLVPLGGSSFLNEVDGNIQCWAEDRTCTIKPHANKWRGVAFEAVAFELRTVTSDRLKDTKGRHIPSVMAVEITEEGAARRGAVAEEDDKSVLRMIHRDKQASLVSIAKALLWFWPDGVTPAKSKAARVIERLKASKLVFNVHGGKYQITKKGCRLIGEPWKDEEE